jgi:parvulin-like peptidyl-prolyl isomerase
MGLVAGVVLGLALVARSWWPTPSATAQTRGGTSAPVTGAQPQGTAHIPRPVGASAAESKVAAVVNGQAISREQLAQESVRRYGKEVVENLVNKHLILQACKERKITITAQEVELEIDHMASKFGLSKDRWLDMLRQERNINPQQYRNDIIWPTIALRKLAADDLQIAPAEIAKAIESQHGEKRQVRMIMIKDKARCEQVHKYLASKPEKTLSSEFGKVAKDYSEDKPSAAARGLIPPVRKHVGDPAIEAAVYALGEGKLSGIVAAADHHFIFLCEKIIKPDQISPQQLKMVEMQAADSLKEQKLRESASGIFKSLQDKAQIVNVYNSPELKDQMPGVAATINGEKLTIRQLSDECISRHGVEVLEGEIHRVLLEQQLKAAKLSVEQADINAEVARAAEMYGFMQPDGTPDVEAWLAKVIEEDNATVELYVRDAVWPTVALKKLVGNQVQIAQDDLQKAYDANYGEQVEVLVCVLGSQRRAQEVWEMARGNPTEKFFADLAYQYSIEPTSKYNYGKVPPIRQHSGQPQLEEEAFRLKAGELSGILVLGDKFIVMRCVGRIQPEHAPDFAAVRDELHKDIYEKKLRIAMSQRFDKLLSAAKIDNYLAGTRQSGGAAVGGAPLDTAVRPASATRAIAPAVGSRQPIGSGAR